MSRANFINNPTPYQGEGTKHNNMNGIEIIILVTVSFILAALVGTYLTRDHKSLKELTKDYYVNEEKLAEELYNKDLRPVAAKKEPVKQLVHSAKELVKEIEKVSETVLTEEQSKQMVEDLVEIATTTPKKKRKYYPKKKKA